ncbi:hypothetical protein GF373_01665 [bacterium]|nr:hypothetical protein [bacterium]
MRISIIILILFAMPFILVGSYADEQRNDHYITNQAPLKAEPYAALPLGTIEPKGWLEEQLLRMKTGLTGHLDTAYPKVCGPRNGWLGGDGDGWERGPYWLDGLLPLAYILNDETLIEKTKPWIEWTLTHQQDSGYFGPIPFEEKPKPEPGIQKTPRRDWWPKMVMLKVLQQYYTATKDERVIALMTNYFRYQLKELPDKPLGNWTFWGNRRGGENLMVVYWLYNITGDKFLLDLADLLFEQTFPWTEHFLEKQTLYRQKSLHCVNLAMGLKQPVIYYQQHPEDKYIDAAKTAFRDIRRFHGQPQGMYGADELLHGRVATQGSEFCSTVEMMFSLENLIRITGDVEFADHLEKVAFNSLPTQANDEFTAKQYYQQPNQVLITKGYRNFYTDNPYRIVYGLLTGYPCCTTNMHQAWPKFTQHLWYASADNGLAAMAYSPCAVKALVADGREVRIVEETNYPFADTIRFHVECENPVEFPLHLRIPSWCKEPKIAINGKTWREAKTGAIVRLNRQWENGDEVELTLPMHIRTSRWYQYSVAVERGPLVYALRIGEDWRKVSDANHQDFYEVYPTDPWNFGIWDAAINNIGKHFKVEQDEEIADYPWNLANAPIRLITKGKRIADWQLENGMAGHLPCSPQYHNHIGREKPQDITLIPYGCTTLRISEFPVVR